jgi:hypothetical protein
MHKIQLTYKNQPLNWPKADRGTCMFIERAIEKTQTE